MAFYGTTIKYMYYCRDQHLYHIRSVGKNRCFGSSFYRNGYFIPCTLHYYTYIILHSCDVYVFLLRIRIVVHTGISISTEIHFHIFLQIAQLPLHTNTGWYSYSGIGSSFEFLWILRSLLIETFLEKRSIKSVPRCRFKIFY